MWRQQFEAQRRQKALGREITKPVAENGPVKALDELRRRTELTVSKILLPHQLTRLHQILLQSQIRRESHIPLLSSTLAKRAGLTEAQHKALKEAYGQAAQKGQAKARSAYDEALGAIIGSLTPEQRARYYTLVGKQFY